MESSFQITPSGSCVAVHRSPPGSVPVVVIGGLASRSIASTPMRALLDHFSSAGLAYTIVDLPGTGRSTYRPPLTIDGWIADLEAVYEGVQRGPSLWIGSSIGAWIVLLIHRRHPDWFSSMCVVAPAIDWDATYLLPGVASGRFLDEGDAIRIEHGTIPHSLVTSMGSHHLLGRELSIQCALHCIYGALDEMVPAASVEQLIGKINGAPCTSQCLPHDGHSMSKLVTKASQQALGGWLAAQVAR